MPRFARHDSVWDFTLVAKKTARPENPGRAVSISGVDDFGYS